MVENWRDNKDGQGRNRHEVIVMLRDHDHPLGKVATIHADNSMTKAAKVSVSFAHALAHHVPTMESLRDRLLEASEDPHCAVMNSGFHGIEFDEPFVIVSKAKAVDMFGKALNLDIYSDDALFSQPFVGMVNGKETKVVVRLKATTFPSVFQIADRDVSAHTPPEIANLTEADWASRVDRILPGFQDAERLITTSASSRIEDMLSTTPTSTAGHHWFRVADPMDMEAAKMAARFAAMECGPSVCWYEPRFSRETRQQLPGPGSQKTVIDLAVWDHGRLIFCGKPTILKAEGVKATSWDVFDASLTIKPAAEGANAVVDTANIPVARDVEAWKRISRAAGSEISISSMGDSWSIHQFDLYLADEVITPGGVTTVRKILEQAAFGKPLKIRCQTPFRASESFAAFVSFTGDDEGRRIFIHDSGTHVSHFLNSDEWFSSARVIAQLSAMKDGQLRTDWPKVMERMADAGAIHEVLVWLREKLPGFKLPDLRKVLSAHEKQRKAKAKADARARRVEQMADGRMTIIADPTRSATQAEECAHVIAENHDPSQYMVYADNLVYAEKGYLPGFSSTEGVDAEPPKVVQLKPHEDVTITGLIEDHILFVNEIYDPVKDELVMKPTAIPPRIPRMILARCFEARHCAGVVTHPIVTPSGEIISEIGWDPRTCFFIAGEKATHNLRPYSQPEAIAAGKRLMEFLGRGFTFNDEEACDGMSLACCIAGLLTGMTRKLLPRAPGLLITAAGTSSGKTTLMERIIAPITGAPAPMISLSQNASADETSKKITTALKAGQEFLALDNIPAGERFSNATLTMCMTSPSYQDRAMGTQNMLNLPTSVFPILTGNNVALGEDEVDRFLICRITVDTANPQTRAFEIKDATAYALNHRDMVLRDVVGIIAGAICSGYVEETTSRTRFTEWDAMVRRPMLWATPQLPDIGLAFVYNRQNSSDVDAATHLLQTLIKEIGFEGDGSFADNDGRGITASTIAKRCVLIGGGGNDDLNGLRNAFEMMGTSKPDSCKSIGATMTKLVNKWIPIHHNDEEKEAKITYDKKDVGRFYNIKMKYPKPVKD